MLFNKSVNNHRRNEGLILQQITLFRVMSIKYWVLAPPWASDWWWNLISSCYQSWRHHEEICDRWVKIRRLNRKRVGLHLSICLRCIKSGRNWHILTTYSLGNGLCVLLKYFWYFVAFLLSYIGDNLFGFCVTPQCVVLLVVSYFQYPYPFGRTWIVMCLFPY